MQPGITLLTAPATASGRQVRWKNSNGKALRLQTSPMHVVGTIATRSRGPCWLKRAKLHSSHAGAVVVVIGSDNLHACRKPGHCHLGCKPCKQRFSKHLLCPASVFATIVKLPGLGQPSELSLPERDAAAFYSAVAPVRGLSITAASQLRAGKKGKCNQYRTGPPE